MSYNVIYVSPSVDLSLLVRQIDFEQAEGISPTAWSEVLGLIDIGLDSRIGPQSTTSDTTYYAADTVHRTAAGHRVVAELTRQAIFNQV
jgi:hypothetical protein